MLRWEVYVEGKIRAACLHVEDAAMLVSCLGNGATIEYHGLVNCTVWTEGAEDQPAGESYDYVAEVAHQRAGL